jgi:hypothetical protein
VTSAILVPMRLAFTTAAALLVWAALAVPASAQEPGVHVDPDSPTGQEYDIPLERARRKSSPSEDEGARGSRTPADTLFGAGIESPDDDGGGGGDASNDGGSGAGNSSSGAKRAGSTASREHTGKRPATVQAAISNPGAPDGGAGGTLLLGGIAVALLGAGLAGGLLLRRRP